MASGILDHSGDFAPATKGVVAHPSSRLHYLAFDAMLPAVAAIATQKNVWLGEHDDAAILTFCLQGLSRKAMRGILNGKTRDILRVQKEINHGLDILAMSRCVMIMRCLANLPALEGAELAMEANRLLKTWLANDRGHVMNVWRDPIEEVASTIQRMFDEQERPMVVVPTSRIMVRGIAKRRAQ